MVPSPARSARTLVRPNTVLAVAATSADTSGSGSIRLQTGSTDAAPRTAVSWNGMYTVSFGSVQRLARRSRGNGVTLQRSSEASFETFRGPSTVTGNGGSGVSVRGLSFAFFQAGNNVTGNLSGTDVSCLVQFPGTRGALTNIGGGTTNCVEP
jgi:hypothetical protein